MPLVDLKTNLKSLKYGNDQPGGGSSGQPYITTDVDGTHLTRVNLPVNNLLNSFGVDKIDIPLYPNASAELNKSKSGTLVNTFLSGDDFIRGGAAGATQAAINDTLRIGSFFVNIPKGPIFLAKQIGLQFSNPRVEVKGQGGGLTGQAGALAGNVGNLSVGGALGSLTGGVLGPTRIYNLGINTLAQIPVSALGGHFVRHGLVPGGDKSTSYEAVAKFNNGDLLNNVKYIPPASAPTNRLLRLSKKFSLGPTNFKPAAGILQTAGGAVLSGLGTALRFISQKAQQWTGITFPNYNVYDTNIVDSYLGGPGSLYGVGSTTINRTTYTNNEKDIKDAINRSKEIAGQAFVIDNGSVDDSRGVIDYTRGLGVNNRYQDPANSINAYASGSLFQDPLPSDNSTLLAAIKRYGAQDIDGNNMLLGSSVSNPDDQSRYNLPVQFPLKAFVTKGTKLAKKTATKTSTVPTYATYEKLIRERILTNFTFIDKIDKTIFNDVDIFSDPENFNTRVSPTIGYYNPDTQFGLKISGSFDSLSREKIWSGKPGGVVASRYADVINLTPLFTSTPGTNKDSLQIRVPDVNGNLNFTQYNFKDFVPFQIEAIDGTNPSSNSTWMIFRALLTNLSDDVNSSWVDIKYAGRGEKFYVYDGFTRKMNVSFKVAATSALEMETIYQKLNYLMGNLMPDYKSNLMRGPLVRMTIGNYINGQLAKLDSLSLKVPQDSPWEIALGEGDKTLVLPHIVEVSLAFTPIGSETGGVNYASQKNASISHIAQAPSSKTQYIKPGTVRETK
jgi:hypothetical protein